MRFHVLDSQTCTKNKLLQQDEKKNAHPYFGIWITRKLISQYWYHFWYIVQPYSGPTIFFYYFPYYFHISHRLNVNIFLIPYWCLAVPSPNYVAVCLVSLSTDFYWVTTTYTKTNHLSHSNSSPNYNRTYSIAHRNRGIQILPDPTVYLYTWLICLRVFSLCLLRPHPNQEWPATLGSAIFFAWRLAFIVLILIVSPHTSRPFCQVCLWINCQIKGQESLLFSWNALFEDQFKSIKRDFIEIYFSSCRMTSKVQMSWKVVIPYC